MKFKRFLSNTHDPSDPQASWYVAIRIHESPAEAWQHHLYWLNGKVIGDPKPTKFYSVQELKNQKLVGVYEMMSLKQFLAHVWLCFKHDFKRKFKIYPYTNK